MKQPNDEGSKAQRAVQSVEVGGRLLLALASSLEPLLLKDLAFKAGLPSSRAHPYLVSYCRLGLVRQDDESGRYAPGPAALQLGLTALHQLEPVNVTRPIADALARSTGQAVAMAVWGNLGATVVRMIDAVQPLHVAMRAGTVMSTFHTATGRAFAGALRSEQIADAMAGAAIGSVESVSPPPIAGLTTQLSSAQEDLKKHGCTRAVGRPMPGVNAFSAPVFNHANEPVLVITLLGHQDHVASTWNSPMAIAVKHAAADASGQLGHRR
jgi:DNA-binding IclR family transcriptional regulator